MLRITKITPLLENRGIFANLSKLYSDEKCPSSKESNISNVKGLSSKVLKVPEEDVGPGASKEGEYKNPEYFSYNRTSYFEAEIEMADYRLPQPSPNVPFKQ